MDPNAFELCAERLKAIADPERLRIVVLLRKGALNVSEIAATLHVEIANISHHLSILRRNNIVLATKKGRFIMYELRPDVCFTTDERDSNLKVNFGCCFVKFDGTLQNNSIAQSCQRQSERSEVAAPHMGGFLFPVS